MRALLRPLAGLLRSALGVNGMAARLTAIEAKLERLLVPAVAVPVVAVPVGTASVAQAPVVDTNLMLHQSRGAMLRQMPAGAQRLVSAGCAGVWYFEWVAQCYGPVPEHVGIEFYMPRPQGLPANVTWIENTASDMAGLADGSADLMISGQNIEHLWADEVTGFLVEAARVVRVGGTLAVDSPNRAITQRLNWVHPEHTIELTAGEMEHLLGLAGFRVSKRAGMWLCRDPRTGRMLPYDPNEVDPDWSMTERLVVARDHPADSFLWWIEATRGQGAADRGAIEAYLAGLYAHAWPERLRRMQVPKGLPAEVRGDEDWVLVGGGVAGVVLYGPYVPLRAGAYRAVFQIEGDAGSGWCEVAAAGRVLGRAPVRAGRVVVEFALEGLQFGVEFRCLSDGGGFSVKRIVELESGARVVAGPP